MRGLQGKRVVITGGASGIGEATTRRFVEEGAQVCVFDRDVPAGEKLRKAVPGLAGFVPCDVAQVERIPAAFAKAVEIMGGVDVLINNAGISIRHASCLEITPEEWNRVVGINLTGAFFVAQEAARLMVKQGGGVIVNMASTTTPTTTPPRPASSSSPSPWPSSWRPGSGWWRWPRATS
jgi:NAD(P)-dependent dehydrogenase (short-subunit alcohol dehydrogenase family)